MFPLSSAIPGCRPETLTLRSSRSHISFLERLNHEIKTASLDDYLASVGIFIGIGLAAGIIGGASGGVIGGLLGLIVALIIFLTELIKP